MSVTYPQTLLTIFVNVFMDYLFSLFHLSLTKLVMP